MEPVISLLTSTSRYFIYCFSLFIGWKASAQETYQKINIDGLQREYIIHLPSNFDQKVKHPLVLVFHGGGGTAKNSILFFGMNTVADTAGFIVVYPNGIKKGWNDGRPIKNHTQDDISFIRQLIDQLCKDYPIDNQKIFATGISNGGFFSFALALHLSDRIKAIAPVCATISQDIFKSYSPTHQVSLLLINGTKDPLVPYDGGKVGGKWLNRGQCTSTDQTIKRFLELNSCDTKAIQTAMTNTNASDECIPVKFSYSCSDGNKIQLIRIEGGGHTWPGGKQYLGKRLVGVVCRDFSAAAEVWNFFQSIAHN